MKYENVRFNEYQNGIDLALGMKQYFLEYNEQRRHSSIEDLTPKEVYRNGLNVANTF